MTDPHPQQNRDLRDEITFNDLAGLLWRRLKEMKTVFYLLIVLAIGSLVATVLPQQQPPELYQERYGTFLANIIIRLSLDHVSSAAWFVFLLALLMLSLVACTGNLWKIARGRWRVPDAEAVRGVNTQDNCEKPFTLPLVVPDAARMVRDVAHRQGYQAWEVGIIDGASCVYLCRNRWSAWGTTLAHYAVFLIGLGALLGTIPSISVDEYAEISEGGISSPEIKGMPFQLRLNDFRIELDPTTGAIANYFSDLSVLENNQEVRHQTSAVNRPLKYRGFYVSQASWSLGEAKVRIKVGKHEEELAFGLVRSGEMDPHASEWGFTSEPALAFLANGTTAIVAQDFFIDAKREQGEVLGRNTKTLGTPALNLVIVSGLPAKNRSTPDAEDNGAALPERPEPEIRLIGFEPQMTQLSPPPGEGMVMPPHGNMMMPPNGEDSKQSSHHLIEVGFLLQGETKHTPVGDITFVGVTEASGLGIRKDPGVPLVWIGFIGCFLGMVLVFYLPLRQGYATVLPDAGGASQLLIRLRGGWLSNLEGDTQRLLTEIEMTSHRGRPRGSVT